MDNEHDSNAIRQISFSVDSKDSTWVDKRIVTLRDNDPGFYTRIIDIGTNKNPEYKQFVYKITTHQSNLESKAFKKFIFQLELKFGNRLKIR